MDEEDNFCKKGHFWLSEDIFRKVRLFCVVKTLFLRHFWGMRASFKDKKVKSGLEMFCRVRTFVDSGDDFGWNSEDMSSVNCHSPWVTKLVSPLGISYINLISI